MIDLTTPNIVIGLCIIVVICLAIIYKNVWFSNSSEPVLANTNLFGTGGARKEAPKEDIDFFNVQKGNVGRSIRLSVKDENKIYYLVELKNNKVLIMEQDIYSPEEVDSDMSTSATHNPQLHKVDEYIPEPGDQEEEMLISGVDDVDDMKDICKEQNAAYFNEQKNLFDVMSAEADPDDNED